MAVYKYDAVVKRRTNLGQSISDMETIVSGVTYKVLTVDANTSETLYSDKGITSKTNPVTTTVFAVDDQIDFYCASSTVDLIVVDTAGGYTAFVDSFSPYQHVVVIDECPNVMHHGCIWWLFNNNVATDTGVDFLPVTAVHDVWVEIVTVDATETINVGTADTATGFRNGVDVATAGLPKDTGIITGGSNIDYTAVTTYGSLLVTAITGSDAVATCGGRTWVGPHWVRTSGTDDDLYYTCSSGSDTGYGYIHYFFTRAR